jgi:hypothetical protein
MNHGMTSNGGVNLGGFNPELNQIELQPQPLQSPHQPGMFRTLLAGAASIAGNMFAPGLGSAIGSLIGGGFGGGSGAGMAAAGFASNSANLAEANQLLAVARQANEDQEMVQLQSNLQKSKHEAFMAVIQNIGS